MRVERLGFVARWSAGLARLPDLADGVAERALWIDADRLLHHLTERVRECGRRGEAMDGIRCERDIEHGAERGRDVAPQLRDRGNLARADLLEDLDVALAIEHALSRERLPQHAADAEQVRLRRV